MVTAIAAGTSVFFSFEERDRKRLEVNQEAIGYVRQTETLNRFWNDPANTINEIPRHRDPPLRRQLFHHHRGWGRGAVLGKERRIKIDSAETGPPPGVPVVLGAGMMGDRISVIFASIDDLRSFLVEKC